MLLFGKLLASLILPPGGIAVTTVLALIFLVKKAKRPAVVFTCLSLFQLLLYSSIGFADAIVTPLEIAYPAFSQPPSTQASGAIAIVVLGGGSRASSPDYGGGGLEPEAIARAAYAIQLSRRLDLPLLFSGGKPGRDTTAESEAESARRFWIGLGIDPGRITVEGLSRDTAENALYTKKTVGKGPVILVTSAWHMPRAMLAFKRQGIVAIPAPTDYTRDFGQRSFYDYLPSIKAMSICRLALHEYLGLAWYYLTK